MTLIDELEADSRPTSVGCKVCTWLEDRDDAADWDAAMSKPKERITTRAILRAMEKRGYLGSDNPLRRHRDKGHRVT